MPHSKTPPLTPPATSPAFSGRPQHLKIAAPANDSLLRLATVLGNMATALQNQSAVVNKFRDDNLDLTEAMDRLQKSAERHEQSLAFITTRAAG